jgi:hypothetical protein
MPGNAPAWVSWPTFSANVICASKAAAFCPIWASVRGAAGSAAAAATSQPTAHESLLILNMACLPFPVASPSAETLEASSVAGKRTRTSIDTPTIAA